MMDDVFELQCAQSLPFTQQLISELECTTHLSPDAASFPTPPTDKVSPATMIHVPNQPNLSDLQSPCLPPHDKVHAPNQLNCSDLQSPCLPDLSFSPTRYVSCPPSPPQNPSSPNSLFDMDHHYSPPHTPLVSAHDLSAHVSPPSPPSLC